MSDSMSSDIMNIYCWIHSTYTLNDKYSQALINFETICMTFKNFFERKIFHILIFRFNGTLGQDFPMPGLGEDDVHEDRGGVTHHKYYQWVIFMLTLQAGMFYLPRLLWKTAEGGVMKLLVSGLDELHEWMDKSTRKDGVEVVARYFHIT